MKSLYRHISWLIPAICILLIAAYTWRATRQSLGFDLRGFGKLPVVSNGRVQPLDSLARNRILAILGKQRVPGDDAPASPTEWLAELAFEPTKADQRPVFLIHHDGVLGVLNLTQEDGKSFSFVQILPHLADVAEEARRIAAKDSQTWNPYEKGLMNLWRNVGHYQQLKFAIAHPESLSLATDLNLLLEKAAEASAEEQKRDRGEPFDATAIEAAETRKHVLEEWSSGTDVFSQPPPPGGDTTGWRKLPDSAIASIETGSLHPSTSAFAKLGDAWRGGDVVAFNSIVSDYQAWLSENRTGDLRKTGAETLFNELAPFYVCMAVYVGAFLLAIFSWLSGGSVLRIAAFRILFIGLAIHTIGLIARMCLEGRPPVTNLYSSAVFIGWGAIMLSVVLELFYKNAIGTAVAAVVGFATLIIAHHLSLSGDTLEMMRAVLDSNFWLATHVIVITLGYSATFLAGIVAIFYLIRRLLGPIPPATATSLRGMVYGVICFATLASFVGTVLGGIWADQSWGRFWGWDPKENGALLIVIWNAIILHARWGGMVKERGMMVMAIFGNIVTSWSWFGTNMLGIGLHSYGFTDAAFFWLSAFIASQLVIMALGFIPVRKKATA
ncbi:MAG: cytochrome c biogenesis protein CcsA [Luteolibacter sp.]